MFNSNKCSDDTLYRTYKCVALNSNIVIIVLKVLEEKFPVLLYCSNNVIINICMSEEHTEHKLKFQEKKILDQAKEIEEQKQRIAEFIEQFVNKR